MKTGLRLPSPSRRFAARASWRRAVRHSLGFKAPRGWGWTTNPRRAAYNRSHARTTFPMFGRTRRRSGGAWIGVAVMLAVIAVLARLLRR